MSCAFAIAVGASVVSLSRFIVGEAGRGEAEQDYVTIFHLFVRCV